MDSDSVTAARSRPWLFCPAISGVPDCTNMSMRTAQECLIATSTKIDVYFFLGKILHPRANINREKKEFLSEEPSFCFVSIPTFLNSDGNQQELRRAPTRPDHVCWLCWSIPYYWRWREMGPRPRPDTDVRRRQQKDKPQAAWTDGEHA